MVVVFPEDDLEGCFQEIVRGNEWMADQALIHKVLALSYDHSLAQAGGVKGTEREPGDRAPGDPHAALCATLTLPREGKEPGELISILTVPEE
jgi:hypothetical protein